MNAVSETTMTLKSIGFDGVQDPARAEKFLVKEYAADTSPILYYKYESTDRMISDTAHDHNYPWHEVTTAVPRIIEGGPNYDPVLFDENGVEINVDHGFIMDWHGRPMRTVALDANKDILDEAQARAREQAGARRLRRYTEWGFILVKATLTDGPEQRFQLLESEKKQREKAETSMADRLGDLFATVMGKIKDGSITDPPTTVGPSSATELMAAFDKFTDDPRQAAALREQLLGELDIKVPASASEEENSGE